MSRVLAKIEKIVDLSPIENADFIEVATILGWHCVVKKGEFKIGDLCVYFEIDSILPEWSIFEFMRDRHFKVKTIKLRKQISQGLALPLNDEILDILYKDIKINIPRLNDLEHKYFAKKANSEPFNVTEILGVTKYDPEADREAKLEAKREKQREEELKRRKYAWLWKIPVIGEIWDIVTKGKRNKKAFPGFIPKTDEERIQNMPHLVGKNKIFPNCYTTEKIDGCSATYFVIPTKEKLMYSSDRLLGKLFKLLFPNGLRIPWKDHIEYGICSRNYRKDPNEDLSKYYQPDPTNSATWLTKNVWVKVSKKYEIEKILRAEMEKNYPKGIAIQGEIIGPHVGCALHNSYRRIDEEFYVFGVFDIGEDRYLPIDKMIEFCNDCQLKHVPIININFTLNHTVDELVSMSNGLTMLPVDKPSKREGIVVRSKDFLDRSRSISFKVVSPEFLLQEGKKQH